ncbi:PTS sugar transporter subunit IIA [Pseudomonadales bacterium]|nr:PTS sugar transporter subunit IIA [Pseudomonadales bacterium]
MKNRSTLIREVLSPQRIRLNQQASSKKKALELCAGVFAESDSELNQDVILEALSAREKLGSTALEHGVALPHCRISGCTRPLCALITLTEDVDFDARDQHLSNMLCALIVPEDALDEHLEILAALAELLSAPYIRQSIRSAHNNNELYLKITESKYIDKN